MKACISVDYLAHDWNATDLILARKELQKQKSKTTFDLTTKTDLNKKELKKLTAERYKQIRYENAIWRQMARKCTTQLGSSNDMVNPSAVNWQKESDITWLYGPLYVASESKTEIKTQTPNTSSIQLKSVLKHDKAKSEKAMLKKDYWASNNRLWSKCASESGKQSVRFNPDITEVSYIVDSPVDPSTEYIPHTEYSYNYAEEDDEEQLWDVLNNVGAYLRTYIFTAVNQSKSQYKPIKVSPNPKATAAATSIYQSTVTFTSWLLYKGANTIINRTFSTLQQHNNNNTL